MANRKTGQNNSDLIRDKGSLKVPIKMQRQMAIATHEHQMVVKFVEFTVLEFGKKDNKNDCQMNKNNGNNREK